MHELLSMRDRPIGAKNESFSSYSLGLKIEYIFWYLDH
jgi:hypothetical protein